MYYPVKLTIAYASCMETKVIVVENGKEVEKSLTRKNPMMINEADIVSYDTKLVRKQLPNDAEKIGLLSTELTKVETKLEETVKALESALEALEVSNAKVEELSKVATTKPKGKDYVKPVKPVEPVLDANNNGIVDTLESDEEF